MCSAWSRRGWRAGVAVAAVTMLAGCATVGPDYVPPEMRAPDDWSAPAEAGGPPLPAPDLDLLASWWTAFDDPLLTSLVERAVDGSLDVRTALSRLREARLSLGVTEADRLPVVDAAGSANVTRVGADGASLLSEFYRVGLDASWEIDLFGGIARSIEAAMADLDSRHANLQDVLVTLVGDVALEYVGVRSLQRRIAVAEANIQAQEETFDLTRFRAQAGLASEVDVEQALSNLESTRAQIPAFRAELSRTRHRLAVLVGETPAALDADLAAVGPIPVAPLDVAVGVPAETLRRRPDIRRAERQIAVQSALVGVTTAQLYPQLRLSGSIGLEALAADELVSLDALSLGGGPSFSWRLFDRGQIRRSIEVQTELQEQSLIAYEASVLAALAEVEDALVGLAEEQLRLERLTSAAAAAGNAVELSILLYEAGLRDFSEVLVAQRSLLSIQDLVAVSESEVTANLIRLFKALGGGWDAEALLPSVADNPPPSGEGSRPTDVSAAAREGRR